MRLLDLLQSDNHGQIYKSGIVCQAHRQAKGHRHQATLHKGALKYIAYRVFTPRRLVGRLQSRNPGAEASRLS
jgi:hypothetical protein